MLSVFTRALLHKETVLGGNGVGEGVGVGSVCVWGGGGVLWW